ncbi:hypothetical protein AVEN_181875-1 [Araneus ventricosus]|uniref:Uncharacterized protein n=1 Tax=Araneus ventricosus TaxID=182803 RepID=A0A4Y2NSC6_ARAVE|nr:hypothetical protein AVEN_181875-1 [Araneus ventricosus]
MKESMCYGGVMSKACLRDTTMQSENRHGYGQVYIKCRRCNVSLWCGADLTSGWCGSDLISGWCGADLTSGWCGSDNG